MKEKEKIILTIAIPTYNRNKKLQDCLSRVLTETAPFPNVEILVSDNASTDGTEHYMRAFCKEHPEVQYYRNETNCGPDQNFLNCYARARGEYVFLLGDDDMLLPGSVDSILASLCQHPVILFLNTCNLESDEPLTTGSPRLIEQGDLIFTNRDAILKEIGIFVTFLSGMVLRTELVQQIADKEQYIGTYFIQSHIALNTMAKDGIYIVNTKNCLAATGNETIGYDLYFVWFEQYHKLFTETAANCGFSEPILHSIYSSSIRHEIKSFILSYRLSCDQQATWDKRCVRENLPEDHPLLCKVILALVYCPRWGVRLVDLVRKLKALIRNVLPK